MDKKRQQLVVQVRKAGKTKARRIDDATSGVLRTGGLPSFSARAAPPQPPLPDVDESEGDDEGHSKVPAGDPVKSMEADLFGDENDNNELPSETFMVFTSLLNDPSRAIAIPLSHTGDCIYGVLPCQLHTLLDHDNCSDVTVSRELQQLLRSRTVCRLRLSSSSSMHVLLLRSDYCRAVASIVAHLRNQSSELGSEAGNMKRALDWFIHSTNIIDTVIESDLEAKWQSRQRRTNSSKASVLPFVKVLSILQQHQVLRVCDTSTSDRSVYQLWLPHWGVVVHAWQRASSQLLAQLKRTHYKERSVSALVQANRRCPVPVPALIDALVSQGEVVRVQRPSGMFVKLP